MSDQWNDRGQPGNQYGQQDPGQYGQPHQQGPYGQQNQQPTPYAQGQQQYPPQGWEQNQPMYGNQYGGNQYGYAAAPVVRPRTLGLIGLALVVVSTIAVTVVAWTGGQGFGQFFLDMESSGAVYNENDLMNDPLTQAYIKSATGLVLAAVVACLAGTAGWIVSIVATAQRRGRGLGIVGIILGILSLPVSYAFFLAGFLPAFEQLNG